MAKSNFFTESMRQIIYLFDYSVEYLNYIEKLTSQSPFPGGSPKSSSRPHVELIFKECDKEQIWKLLNCEQGYYFGESCRATVSGQFKIVIVKYSEVSVTKSITSAS